MTGTTAPGVTAERFAELFEEHRGIVLKVAGTYCRNPADRDDLAQEIAAQLWRALPRYDAERTFSTWMYPIALNVAISRRAPGSPPARSSPRWASPLPCGSPDR
jgi:RNA polymerase sigma factor (sigma-70 family)